jgi:hypothetical protein
MNIGYNNKLIINISNTKFLRIVIDNMWSWNINREQIIPQLSAVCYAIRSVKPHVTENIKDGLLFLFSFHYELWINSLGTLLTKCKNFQDIKEYN